MNDLVLWLSAQLDHDEQVARSAEAEIAAVGSSWQGFVDSIWKRTSADIDNAADLIEGNGPAQALRQVAAHRRILARHHLMGNGCCSWCWGDDEKAGLALCGPARRPVDLLRPSRMEEGMGLRTDMLLFASDAEDAAIGRLNAWCAAHDDRYPDDPQQFRPLATDVAGGAKVFTCDVWARSGRPALPMRRRPIWRPPGGRSTGWRLASAGGG